MEKKNTSPTVAEQKQEFLLPKSANVFKSELLRAAREIFSIANRIRIQSAILTDDDLRPYTKEFNGSIQEFTDETNEELIAHELCEDIFSDFIRFGHILIEVVRKEVVYEN